MKKHNKLLASVLGVITLSTTVSGCLPQSYQRTPMATPGVNSNFQPAGAVPSGVYGQQMQSQVPQMAQNNFQPQVSQHNPGISTQEVSNLRERLRRTERAMIRLDRRMQLLERNELARITSGAMNGNSTVAPTGGFQPMSFVEPNAAPQFNLSPVPVAPRALPAQPAHRPFVGQQSRGAQFQPVTASIVGDNVGIIASAPVSSRSVASPSHKTMPSLADKTDDAQASGGVSIWTISYEDGKVWPARSQLVASREVIDALKSEEPIAVYARGVNPATREFRERVRAVSKYLSKVTDLDNITIASMKSDHMASDTIEIMTTR